MKPGPLQEQDGSWSLRRCLAAFFALLVSGATVGILVQLKDITNPWIVVALLGILMIAILLLMFFTTWSDIAEVISAAGKSGESGTAGKVGQ